MDFSTWLCHRIFRLARSQKNTGRSERWIEEAKPGRRLRQLHCLPTWDVACTHHRRVLLHHGRKGPRTADCKNEHGEYPARRVAFADGRTGHAPEKSTHESDHNQQYDPQRADRVTIGFKDAIDAEPKISPGKNDGSKDAHHDVTADNSNNRFEHLRPPVLGKAENTELRQARRRKSFVFAKCPNRQIVKATNGSLRQAQGEESRRAAAEDFP